MRVWRRKGRAARCTPGFAGSALAPPSPCDRGMGSSEKKTSREEK